MPLILRSKNTLTTRQPDSISVHNHTQYAITEEGADTESHPLGRVHQTGYSENPITPHSEHS